MQGTAHPVIDAHGHLLVPEANALVAGHPRQAADEAAELESFPAHSFDMGVTAPVERATAAGLPAADLTAILSRNAADLFDLA